MIKNLTKNEIKKEYERLTDWNEHGEAIKLICQYYKRNDLVEKMEHINALHLLYGNLTKPLGIMRDEIWEEVAESFYKDFN